MKHLLLAVAFALLTVPALAQGDDLVHRPRVDREERPESSSAFSENEWKALLNALRNEQWETATDLSRKFLAHPDATSSTEKARLRFMYIFALAGQANDGKITYAALSDSLQRFIGMTVSLPGHPIVVDHPGALNSIQPHDSSDEAMISEANIKGTQIFYFIYIKFDYPVDLAANQGQVGYITAALQSVEINPRGKGLWIARLRFDKGSMSMSWR